MNYPTTLTARVTVVKVTATAHVVNLLVLVKCLVRLVGALLRFKILFYLYIEQALLGLTWIVLLLLTLLLSVCIHVRNGN